MAQVKDKSKIGRNETYICGSGIKFKKCPSEKILESGCNLSASHYNLHGPEDIELLEPSELGK